MSYFKQRAGATGRTLLRKALTASLQKRAAVEVQKGQKDVGFRDVSGNPNAGHINISMLD